MMRKPCLLVLLAATLLLLGCASTTPPAAPDGGSTPICSEPQADPAADEEGDGISSLEEGCLQGRDSDGDGNPDWKDLDSDNDKIPDAIEAGLRDVVGKCAGNGGAPASRWPCDSDGDSLPDYLDTDSDSDKLADSDEDLNGDGLLGCCLQRCGQAGAAQVKGCVLTDDGCGPGQICQAGLCSPPAMLDCSDGETDPKKKVTFNDGKPDAVRGAFICRDATEDRPRGRKPVQLRKSQAGEWQVALDRNARYADIPLSGPAPKEAAAVMDHVSPTTDVAGLLLSRDTSAETVQAAIDPILQSLSSTPPGGGTLTLLASGTAGRSHDGYDSIQGITLELKLVIAADVSAIRNELLALLLGRPPAQLGNLPAPYGGSTTQLTIRLLAVRRFEFKKDDVGKLVLDSKGFPVDSGDAGRRRLLITGAVANTRAYLDPGRATGVLADDLSNGTSLATAGDAVSDQCDVTTVKDVPRADIIWIMDESSSMDNKRKDVVANAADFFTRASSSGLDFRIAVTGVADPSGPFASAVGKFCSKVSSDAKDDGGADRFLLPNEMLTFSSCVQNPPGFEDGSEFGLTNALEAVKRHLPRAEAPDRIRPGAKLVVILASDEVPQELYRTIVDSDPLHNLFKCSLDAPTQATLQQQLQPYLEYFSGATGTEAATMFHLIGGACGNTCSAQVPHGYRELMQQLGGIMGDICQSSLGGTLQRIIDSIAVGASPIRLRRAPISTSLAVTLDGNEIPRSRSDGFDYGAAARSLVFFNTKFKKGSEVIASYKWWRRQTEIQ